MKKISILLAPIIILMAIYGCSKDHESPVFSKFDDVNEPTEVEATYNKASDEFTVSWTMTEKEGVVDYIVAWSDSNLFDETQKQIGEKYVVKDLANNPLVEVLTIDSEDVFDKMDYFDLPDVDKFIVYFTVSAVYNMEGFNYFIGPRAVVETEGTYADSAIVIFKEE